MISLVSALVIEHGEKKYREGESHGGGVKKLMPRRERKEEFKGRDRKNGLAKMKIAR